MGYTIELRHIDVIPAGEYPAKITNIEKDDGRFGEQLKFTFNLQPGDNGERRELIGWTSYVFSTRSKLYKWVRAALFDGGQIPRGYVLDTDDLLGKPVILVVTKKLSEEGDEFNKVDDVLPYRQQEPPPEPMPVSSDEPW
jgi:hypothetical protein